MKKRKSSEEEFDSEVYDNTDIVHYDDELLFDQPQIKISRSKEKYQARKKIEDYLERKSLKELIGDY